MTEATELQWLVTVVERGLGVASDLGKVELGIAGQIVLLDLLRSSHRRRQ
jgi:hypothetical protein